MRRLFLAAALAAAATGSATPLHAQAAQTAAADPHLAKAAQLVEAINGYDDMVQTNMRGWEAGMRQSFLADPTLVALEKQHPGITNAAIEGARPLGVAYVTKFVRGALDRKAEIISGMMSDAEIQTALTFFQGPVGRKLVSRMGQQLGSGIDELAAEKAKQSRETGTVKFEEEEMRAKLQQAAIAATSSFTPEENIAAMRFGATDAARKLTAAGQQADSELLAQMNNPPADFVMAQSQAAQKAMLAFIDSK